jgi:hypothetical protein
MTMSSVDGGGDDRFPVRAERHVVVEEHGEYTFFDDESDGSARAAVP